MAGLHIRLASLVRGQSGPTVCSMVATIEWVRLIGDKHELLLPEMKKRPRIGIPGRSLGTKKWPFMGLATVGEAKNGSGQEQERNHGWDAEGDHYEDDRPGKNGASQHDQEADKDVVAGFLEA